MAERKSLSKKIRFEVFKRDSFTCQYCGSKSPDVVLNVDHINPVAKGGKNEMLNLITSCFSCNSGKSDRQLSDKTIVEKQRVQIEELNLRRQQLEMLLEWKTGLQDIKSDEAQKVSDYIEKITGKVSLTPVGLKNMQKHIKKFGLQEILDAVDIAFDKYYKEDEEGSDAIAFKKVPAIAFINTQPKHMKDIAYVKGILRNRIYLNDAVASKSLLEFHNAGGNMQSVIEYAKKVRNWTIFIAEVQGATEKMLEESELGF